MSAHSVFQVTTSGPVAHDLLALFESGELGNVTSLEVDPDAALENRPLGANPVVTLLIEFVMQVGASVTATFVTDYLLAKLRKRSNEVDLSVKKKEE